MKPSRLPGLTIRFPHPVRLIALAVLAGSTALFAPSTAQAQTTLAEYLGGIGEVTRVPGQSVTLPSGGPYNNITFNFFAGPATPTAGGTLFVLTESYAGTPADLSSATPGFVGQSLGTPGGVYTFAPTVTLQGGTQYFFYANQELTVTVFPTDDFAGGNFFEATTTTFLPSTGDANFRLRGTTGTASAAPEPGSLALLVCAALSSLPLVGAVMRRKIHHRCP